MEIPSFVKVEIEKLGVKASNIRALAQSDLDFKGNFRATWLCIDDTWLYIFVQEKYADPAEKPVAIQPRMKLTNLFKHDRKAKDIDIDVRNFSPKVKLVTKYALDEIEALKCHFFVGSAAITAKMGGHEQVICRASKSKGVVLNQFCRQVNQLSKKQEAKDKFEDMSSELRCPKCGRQYPDPNRLVCPHCIDKKTLFKRVLALTPKYKGTITLMIIIMFAGALLSLAAPYLSGRVLIDEAITPGGRFEGMIGVVVLVAILSSLASLVLNIAHGRINAGITAEIIYDLKTMIFTAMQRLSLNFYSMRQTGALMNRVNNDAMDLQNFFHDGLPYFIVNSVKLVGITVSMMLFNWRLTLLVFIPVPIIIFFIYKVLPYLWKLYSRRFRTNAALNSVVNDSLTGVRVVKAFGKEEEEINRFSNRNIKVYDVQMSIGRLSSTLFPALGYIMGLGQLIVWGVGGWDVVTGRMTFGTFVTFTGYLAMLYEPIRFMTEIVDWWSSTMNSAQRIFEIVDSTDYLPSPAAPVKIPSMQGHIKAENVEFGYEEGKPVLQEINFAVKPGEMIGLVGHSGAGKSTMINLIARLYDVKAGAIMIDDVNIKNIDQDNLHSQIGMVLQETFLFSGSIWENIAYAKPNASSEEVIRAAKIANAHDFIVTLPDGYETIIGRKGHDLSGGERQRLAIARAVLLDPKILILDEATANIDTETEQLIQEALEQLVEGRTTFAIAHRLSTLRKADRLLVFDKGKIVEVGTHDQLIAKQGVYEKLYTTQRKALELTAVGG